MSAPASEPRISATRQVVWIFTTTWRSTWRKNRLAQSLAYGLLLAALIPASIFVGEKAYQAGLLPTTQESEWMLFAFLLGFLFIKGLLAGTVQLETSKLLTYPVAHETALLALTCLQFLSPSLLLFVGVGVGFLQAAPQGGVRVAITLLAVAEFLVMVHALALVVRLVVANLLRSRRLRDFGTLLGSFFVVGLYLLIHLGRSPEAQEALATAAAWVRPIVAYLPSSWTARALHPSTSVGQSLLWLLAVSAANGLLLMAVLRLHRLAFFGELAPPRSTAARAAKLSRIWRWSWLSPEVGGVVAKELSFLKRDPMVRDLIIRQLGLVLVPTIPLLISSDGQRHPLMLLLLAHYVLTFGEAVILSNFFALDDRGLTSLLCTPAPRWKILLGKNLACLFGFGPINVALGVALPLLLGAKEQIPLGMTLAVAGLLTLLAVSNFASTLGPYRLLPRRRTVLEGDPSERQGCLAWVPRFLFMAVGLVLSIPAALVITLPLVFQGPASYVWTLPAALLYSIALVATTLPLAAKVLEEHEEKLLRTFVWHK